MKYISLVYLFRFTFHIWQTRPEFWIFVTTLSINCSVSMMILLLNPGVIDVLHQVLLHLLGWEEQGHPWLWVPWVLSLLWHKRAGVSNTSDLILDFEWTSLEARERERERALHYIWPSSILSYFLDTFYWSGGDRTGGRMMQPVVSTQCFLSTLGSGVTLVGEQSIINWD